MMLNLPSGLCRITRAESGDMLITNRSYTWADDGSTASSCISFPSINLYLSFSWVYSQRRWEDAVSPLYWTNSVSCALLLWSESWYPRQFDLSLLYTLHPSSVEVNDLHLSSVCSPALGHQHSSRLEGKLGLQTSRVMKEQLGIWLRVLLELCTLRIWEPPCCFSV